MEVALILIICLVVAVSLVLFMTNRRLTQQTHLMRMQGREIEKQVQELRNQNKLLEELNKEKQQIIGVVSHDLKGPFNRIFALMQLMSLSTENLTSDQRDYLGKIHQIVADGLGMVRNLLDNRRIEDKGLEPMIEPVNATTAISAIVKNYRILAAKKQIEILYETPAPINVLADKIYLSRIMDNLLTNAIKFSPAGRRVWVSLCQKEKQAIIKVKDEGPGLTADDREMLFQKYQRLTPRPTGGESSTGLGLYLVHAMVTRMGGSVSCESEPEKGSVFEVRLPAVS